MAELTPKVEGRMDKASSGTVVGVPAAGAPADEPGGGLKGKVTALLSSAKETAGHVYSQVGPPTQPPSRLAAIGC